MLSKRLAHYIRKEMRLEFGRVIYLVDSVIVRAMIEKQSYGFKTFAATRIGEIQQDTQPHECWWCKGEINIADAITRGVDLFGHFTTRGEVNKRARGKSYGVVFDCLVTRAVYIDIATSYSADAFLLVFRKFVSLRGYPKEVYSDGGTQLSAAAKQLKEFGGRHGVNLKFSTPDAPWQNGVTESLVKGIKKVINHAIGEQILIFSELQAVMFEAANLANERPIGKHSIDPQDGAYLCPNDLLLGRSSGKVPDGPWSDNKGDIVMVQDSNMVRGKWRIGRVTEASLSADNVERNVEAMVGTESGLKTNIKRAVQRLVVLLPVEEQYWTLG
ncbi:uncharacterized protein LOC117125437 [Anneissia japonica]|uniref:uncharacterized protein LOC117125437 n=1 Tax=Anneissia japonica TaxID=1529436 RepID=UPI001425AE34|nr:uncharacterized protein LOC117125437 [Anneissia japonica]